MCRSSDTDPLRHDTLTHFWATGHPSRTSERVVADEDTQVGQQVPLASAVSCTERLGHRAPFLPDVGEADAALKALARRLERVNPDAAASLSEGMADTLTVTRLGVTGSRLKTVMSTNPVESMIEIVRAHARNVKRWQDGDMRLRWAAAGMLTAAEQFRRVKGYRQLLQLATALRHAIGAEDTSRVAVTA